MLAFLFILCIGLVFEYGKQTFSLDSLPKILKVKNEEIPGLEQALAELSEINNIQEINNLEDDNFEYDSLDFDNETLFTTELTEEIESYDELSEIDNNPNNLEAVKPKDCIS